MLTIKEKNISLNFLITLNIIIDLYNNYLNYIFEHDNSSCHKYNFLIFDYLKLLIWIIILFDVKKINIRYVCYILILLIHLYGSFLNISG